MNTRRPLIVVSAHTERENTEFPDAALSLSARYTDAIRAAGGIALILPPTMDQSVVREALQQGQGVMISGGEDIHPDFYAPTLPEDVRNTVVPAEGNRDAFELILVEETLRQKKPLLAICRGQQILNVALGGDLIADIPLQRPGTLRHNRSTERFEAVHDVIPEPDSLLAQLAGDQPFGVNSTHHQAVDRVAPPLRVTGRSPDGIIEALESRPDCLSHPYLLAVQFHPERLWDRHPVHARIFRSFVDACRAPTGP